MSTGSFDQPLLFAASATEAAQQTTPQRTIPPAIPYGAHDGPAMTLVDDEERAHWVSYKRVTYHW